jgi:peptidoglycan/xylan/chitin deacetylase (PgdA/CDA1 family)
VETDTGQRNIGGLLDIEASYDVRSCWNFVVRRYAVDQRLISALQATGHEVGVHGVYHDGKLFDSESIFHTRLAIMREAAHAWGAVGFRSPSLVYDIALLKRLPFAWDSSMPAWDPFQPKPGDCHRFVPFRLNETCVELPVTLWQDFTLFEELRMRTIAVWRDQIDAIHAVGGLINVVVHPDYMLSPARRDLYRALLDHIVAKPDIWIARPRDVAAHELSRSGIDNPAPLAV